MDGGVKWGRLISQNSEKEPVETALNIPQTSISTAPSKAHLRLITQSSEPKAERSLLLHFLTNDIKNHLTQMYEVIFGLIRV